MSKGSTLWLIPCVQYSVEYYMYSDVCTVLCAHYSVYSGVRMYSTEEYKSTDLGSDVVPQALHGAPRKSNPGPRLADGGRGERRC